MAYRWVRSLMAIATGVILAIAVPAVAGGAELTAAQRELIRNIQCYDHLRQIGLGITLYTNENAGKYPPDLGTLLVAMQLELPVFVCPASASQIPTRWRQMPPAEQSAWVNAHADYVYLGGKKNDFDPTHAVAYDRDDDHPGGKMNVLFADGHVAFLPPADVHRLLGPRAGTERATTRVRPVAGQTSPAPMITLDAAKAILAKADLSRLRAAVMSFELDNGRFPTTKEGLDSLVHKPAGDQPGWRAELDGLRPDPWGHPYVYACPGTDGHDFDLTSAGPDGKPGTGDDVK